MIIDAFDSKVAERVHTLTLHYSLRNLQEVLKSPFTLHAHEPFVMLSTEAYDLVVDKLLNRFIIAKHAGLTINA